MYTLETVHEKNEKDISSVWIIQTSISVNNHVNVKVT